MAGRIITARHGMPDMDRTVRITSREYGDWWAAYDRAGLAPGQEPPKELVDLAKSSDLVLTSTLPRAIETANRLVEGSREVPQNAIFVEAPLPPPPVPFIRLKPGTWGVVSRTYWFLGYTPDGVESHVGAWRRVEEIADMLFDYAIMQEKDVLLAAHGYLNWMINSALKKRGWSKVQHVGKNHYWSYRCYQLPEVQRERTLKSLALEIK